MFKRPSASQVPKAVKISNVVTFATGCDFRKTTHHQFRGPAFALVVDKDNLSQESDNIGKTMWYNGFTAIKGFYPWARLSYVESLLKSENFDVHVGRHQRVHNRNKVSMTVVNPSNHSHDVAIFPQ